MSLQFEFNAKGEIVSCYTPSRFRELNGKYEPTPWGGFFRNYVNRDGMRVPNDSEAYWKIDGVIHPYFKARNVEIHYEFSPLVEQFIRHADVQGAHEVLVHAPADLVMEIVRNFDLESVPIVHAIFWLRGKILGSSPAPRQSLGLVSAMTALGWGKLADIPGRELIMGAVTQP